MSLELEVTLDMGDTLGKLDQILMNIDNSTSIVEFDMDEAVNEIVILAQIICPKGITGQLADSIRGEGSFPSYVILADAVDKYGEQYGKFVEFGTSKMEAQPFLWPSVQAIMFDYIPKIRADFKAAIKGEI